MQGLAVVFTLILFVPLVHHSTPGERHKLNAVLCGIWLIFACDYLMRLWRAKDHAGFVRGHLLDLATICMPTLRPLRIVWIGAGLLGTVGQISRAAVRRSAAFAPAIAVMVTVLGGLMVLSQEEHAAGANIRTPGDAIWWAAVTVTTVGYGDLYPVTVGGRLIAVILMVTGISAVGLVTASVASWLLDQSKDNR